MIRRPPRSTHCISSAASDVYKRQQQQQQAQHQQQQQQQSAEAQPQQKVQASNDQRDKNFIIKNGDLIKNTQQNMTHYQGRFGYHQNQFNQNNKFNNSVNYNPIDVNTSYQIPNTYSNNARNLPTKQHNQLNESVDYNLLKGHNQFNQKNMTNTNSPSNSAQLYYKRKIKAIDAHLTRKPNIMEKMQANDMKQPNSEQPSRHSSIGANNILNNIYGKLNPDTLINNNKLQQPVQNELKQMEKPQQSNTMNIFQHSNGENYKLRTSQQMQPVQQVQQPLLPQQQQFLQQLQQQQQYHPQLQQQLAPSQQQHFINKPNLKQIGNNIMKMYNSNNYNMPGFDPQQKRYSLQTTQTNQIDRDRINSTDVYNVNQQQQMGNVYEQFGNSSIKNQFRNSIQNHNYMNNNKLNNSAVITHEVQQDLKNNLYEQAYNNTSIINQLNAQLRLSTKLKSSQKTNTEAYVSRIGTQGNANFDDSRFINQNPINGNNIRNSTNDNIAKLRQQ
eukprot:TRINITY_DN10725_c0_g1_i3.p1 TRINITY_DN10725_c0_g1~~TRINITY_DN10725_c0_g1_i3.p1  ORF type:complete len:500 (+),score=104.17 TRINITY_DN10725_c0_g1_i3:137-1636(+)